MSRGCERLRRLGVLAPATLVLVLAGCGPQDAISNAAFTAQVSETPCPATTDAEVCLEVVITNISETPGDASCQLYGDDGGTPESSVTGPMVDFMAVAAHSSVSRLVVWNRHRTK